MPDHPTNAEAVARALQGLLSGDARYRRKWQTYAHRARPDRAVNKAAVAMVLALHLWDHGERSDTASSLPRELKDRVSRALNGVAVSAETLTWIIAAFDMDPVDEARLWELLHGSEDTRGISRTLGRDRPMAHRQRHQTVSLFERYLMTDDRSLEVRRTAHTIQAAEDDVDVYIFNHESAADRVEVLYGGRVGERFQYGDGLHAVEILLEQRLRKWESTSLEYRTYFAAGTTFPTEVRRPAFARARNVDLAVRFGRTIPQRAWWCVWSDHVDGGPLQETPAVIRKSAVRRYIPYIEQTVVGFRWEW